MSRVIVKQLPKNITEDKLRSIFGSKGTITDIQLKYTVDGKFRQFGFVGFESEEQAQAATAFFDGTCIQTSRIKVEPCAALGADDKPQSWSKHAKDSKHQQHQQQHQQQQQPAIGVEEGAQSGGQVKKKKKKTGDKVDEIIGEHKNDPAFQEFLKAHDKHRTLWANDAAMGAASDAAGDAEGTDKGEKDSDDAAGKKVVEEEDDDEEEGGAEEPADDGEDDDDDDDDDDSVSNKAKLAEKPISDLEYMKSLMAKPAGDKKPKDTAEAKKESIDLYTIKVHDLPYNTKRQDILKFFKPLKPYSVRLPTNVRGFCYVGFKTEKEMAKGMLKNKSFIKGKQVFFSDFTEKNKITKAKQSGAPTAAVNGKGAAINSKWRQQEDNARNGENISESGRIFFRNLPYTVTEDDLQQVFATFGPVAEIHLPVDTVTRQIKGFGTVTYVMPEHAVQAFNKLDGSDFHGRLLHLIPGKSKDDDADAAAELDEHDAGLSFKQKQALKLKKNAQQPTSWNTLFLGPNAVADILAKQFGMSKEKILDTSEGGSSAAVRIALGETQIVIEMKKFLEENGVSLNVFDAPNAKRSKTIILAKNLPPATTVAELTPIFAKFGPIGRLVLPPSGVTALIEYCDPSEARQAFKKLAYSKFKTAPLYLEWAPEHTFTTTLSGEPVIPKQEVPEQQAEDAAVESEDTPPLAAVADEPTPAAEDDEDDLANEPPEANTTLFLRNLNFKTVQDTVYNHFKHLGPIHTVEIAKRKDAENPRVWVSLGYGFIQFKRSATAETALKRMQFTNIDGNHVELKRSDRTLKTPTNTVQRKRTNMTKQTGTKMLVRNIPFQAKQNEVRDIFKAFGEIRSLRLPLKMTPGESTHRGFGFVDYLNKSDAKKAFEALSQSTHLYGRRLVLEWASNDDDDVTELRKRTAQQFNGGGGGGGGGGAADKMATTKRSKKAVFDVEGNLAGATNGDGIE